MTAAVPVYEEDMEPSSPRASTTLCWCFSQNGASNSGFCVLGLPKNMHFPGQTKGLSKSNAHTY